MNMMALYLHNSNTYSAQPNNALAQKWNPMRLTLDYLLLREDITTKLCQQSSWRAMLWRTCYERHTIWTYCNGKQWISVCVHSLPLCKSLSDDSGWGSCARVQLCPQVLPKSAVWGRAPRCRAGVA